MKHVPIPYSWKGWLLALPPILFVFVFLVVPLTRTLSEGGVHLFVWRDPYFLKRLAWTLGQAAYTAAAALIIGGPLAYLLANYTIPFKGLILRFILLPFITPTPVAALGIMTLVGPTGWLTEPLSLNFDGTPAVILLGNLFFNLPIMVRLAYGGFARVPRALPEAARTLGASHIQALTTITLPLALPGLAAGFILVFLYSALSFGLPLILGGEKYATLEVEIYTLVVHQLRLDEASALIALQLALVLAVTWIYAKLRHGEIDIFNKNLPHLSLKKAFLTAAFLLLVALICFGPLLAVAARSLVGSLGPTLSFWKEVLTDPSTPFLIGNTLRFGFLTLISACLLGLLYAISVWRTRSRFLDLLSLIPLMVSPVSLAVGYLLSYPKMAATQPMLIAAYTLLSFPIVTRSVLPALRALPIQLFEAARTLGANGLNTHRTVTLPLILPALRGGAALALATTLGEFAATVVLTRPEWATLSTGLYEHMGKPGERNLGEACVLATLLLLLATFSFTLLDSGHGEVS